MISYVSLLLVLSCRDSNPERQNQNLLCYHYTTAQSDARKRCKDIISFYKSQIFAKTILRFPDRAYVATCLYLYFIP